MYCKHCPTHEHKYVCDCTHSHDNHNYAGGCRVKGCKCERYSQVLMWLPGQKAKEQKPKEQKPRVIISKPQLPTLPPQPTVVDEETTKLILQTTEQHQKFLETQQRVEKLKEQVASSQS